MKISKSKQRALDKAYDTIVQVCLYDMPLHELELYLPHDVMNFGAGVTEVTTDKETFLKQIENQKSIASGLEMEFQIDPVLRKITGEGDGAIYTDDIINTVWVNGVKNELKFRMSFVFEYVDQRWMMVHSHTSAPDSQRNDDEVWPLEDLKQRTEFLEKSLEEKVAELKVKNRELEIESSLERVRTVAMAMQNPDELLNICQVVFNELQLLGFGGLRNAIIHVFEEDKGFFNDYDYSDSAGGTFARVPLEGNSVLEKFVQKIRASKDSFFEMKVSGVEFESWKAFRKKTDMHDDPQLNHAEALYYYIYSVGAASIGISSFEPIKPVQRDLLMRFRNVFELAYSRYGDIQKAEAQAKEAQIEAALERVRAMSMAMHNSNELKDVATIVYKELIKLKIPEFYEANIVVFDEENNQQSVWSAHTESSNLEMLLLPLQGDQVLNDIFNKWHHQEAFYSREVAGDELHDHINFVIPKANRTEDIEDALMGMPDPTFFNCAFFSSGYIELVANKELSSSSSSILIRFAKVFDQTYTRFLDLQKAEAQAREAQIEAALEKLRSRTMAMEQSNELPEAANLLFKQVQSLGIPAWSAGYCIWENDDKSSATAFMSSEGVLQKPFPFPTKGVGYNFYDPLINGKPFHVEELGGEKLVKHYAFMRTLPIFGEVIDGIIEAGFELPTFQIFHILYFSEGYLMFITYESVAHAYDIFKRFTKAFEQTYTRFLDLQTKEEQSVKLRKEKDRLERTLYDLKAAQKQLIHAEKMASLGELTAGIAHEIQNPLNFVNNFSEVSSELIEEAMDEIEAGEYDEVMLIMKDLNENLQKIHHHGGRASSIVNGMLDHSRSDSGEKVKADINQLAEECIRLSYHGMRAKDRDFQGTFDIHLDPELPKIKIVSQDISRVLLNLINNGFQAAFEKNKKMTDDAFQPKVTVSTKYHDDKIQVSVEDNGPGIPEDIKDKIFQPFFTTKPTGEGTGLGLSLSYDMVKAHGGTIHVESKPGKGTIFKMTLPTEEK